MVSDPWGALNFTVVPLVVVAVLPNTVITPKSNYTHITGVQLEATPMLPNISTANIELNKVFLQSNIKLFI